MPSYVTRRIGARPADEECTLDYIIKNLAVPDVDFHRRDGRASRRMDDLRELSRMINGKVRRGCRGWIHWCHDPATNRPCCRSQEDCVQKTTVALVNGLFGQADPTPAESTWTHTVANFKRTLLRAVVGELGLLGFASCHAGEEIGEVVNIDPDGQAQDNYRTLLNKTRANRAHEYLHNKKNIDELAVLTIIVGTADEYLLYPMMGDGRATEDSPCKIERMIDPESSLLGTCGEALLQLLDRWILVEGSDEKWSVLVALQAPVLDQNFAKSARSAILRLWSSISRRDERKYADWPYKLFLLNSTLASR